VISFDLTKLNSEGVGEYMWQWLSMRTKPLSAHDLLSFAIADLEEGESSRHLVNSLSNAKKALHLRLEDVCLGFGCVDLKNVRNFPQLISYARNCGLVAPRILERLNARRNVIEHEFEVPSKAELETFVDVVQLFLAATDRWESRLPCQMGYHDEAVTASNGKLLREIQFDWSNGRVSLAFKSAGAGNGYSERPDYVEFHSPSDEFFRCVRFLLENDS